MEFRISGLWPAIWNFIGSVLSPHHSVLSFTWSAVWGLRSAGSVLLQFLSMPDIESIQENAVGQNQEDKNDYATLLCKPKTQRKTTESEVVEPVRQQHPAAQSHHRPDDEQQNHDQHVLSPIASDGIHDARIVKVNVLSHLVLMVHGYRPFDKSQRCYCIVKAGTKVSGTEQNRNELRLHDRFLLL